MLLATLAPRAGYNSVLLRIFSRSSGRRTVPGASVAYRAELSMRDGPSFSDLTMRIDFAKLRDNLEDPEGYGQALGKMIFADDAMGKGYGQAVAATFANGGSLDVRLQLDPPELQEIHWERLYHPIDGNWRPLGSTGQTPFSRFVRSQRWTPPDLPTERPLRMLAVIASSDDLTTYQLDPITAQERQALHRVFDALPNISVTYLESGSPNRPTLPAIRRALAGGYHLVHFLCHGAHTPNGTVLFLDCDDGKVDPVATSALVETTRAPAHPPLFCFLAACETATRAAHDAFTPLGPALVSDGGVQAVIAMTEQVGLDTAQQFAGQFYARLLAHGLVDLATNEARESVRGQWDWGAPVLVSGLETNQLLDFPIGGIYSGYLSHSERAAGAIRSAMSASRGQADALEIMAGLNELMSELSNSHKLLAALGDPFRRSGRDPQTFPKQFETFYYDFKSHYDSQDWVKETTSCRKIDDLRMAVMPRLSRLLDKTTFAQLDAELSLLSDADNDTLQGFRRYLGEMNTVVEQVWALLNANKVDEAIKVKLGFEAQMSHSLDANKDALAQMSRRIDTVSKA